MIEGGIDKIGRWRGSFAVCLCAAVAVGISVVALIGWFTGDIQLASFATDHIPLGSQAAALYILFAAALVFVNVGLVRAPRYLLGLILIAVSLQWLGLLELVPKSVNRMLGVFLPRYGFTDELMSLNGSIALAFLAISLLVLTSRVISPRNASIALVFALLGMSISALALYGYVVETEAAYWWHTELPFAVNSAGTIMILGLGLIALAWERFNTPSTHVGEILSGIQLVSGAVLLITVIMSACYTILPLYEALLTKTYDEVKGGVEAKSTDLTRFLSSFRMTVEALTVKDAKQRKWGGTEEDNRLSARSFGDALKHTKQAFPGVSAITMLAFDDRGAPSKSRENIDPPLESDPVSFPDQSLLKVDKDANNQVRIVVEVPITIASLNEHRIARLQLDNRYLADLLLRDLASSVREGTFYLIAQNPTEPASVLTLSADRTDFQFVARDKVPKELRKAFSYDGKGSQGRSRALLRSDNVSFLMPLEGISAYLGFASRVSRLRSLFSAELAKIFIGLASLVMISTALIFFLVRKLARQILSLEGILQHSYEKVERSLAEKEVLLKEIHHRVKNNLQVISSILNLQLRRTKSEEAVVTLRESSNRIQSIALLHETLYRSDNFSKINLREYLEELVRNLSRSYEIEQRIKIKIETNGLELEIDRAITLGLILTELLTNSFKYAFPSEFKQSAQPLVKIQIKNTSEGGILFSYSDNGKGLPPEFSLVDASSLGCRLISSLAQQFGGEMSFRAQPGMSFQIVTQSKVQIEEQDHGQAANSYS